MPYFSGASSSWPGCSERAREHSNLRVRRMNIKRYHLWLPRRASRRRFGKSFVGRFFNWVTQTWHRWNVFVLILIIWITLCHQNPESLHILRSLIAAPPLGFLAYPVWLLIVRASQRVSKLNVLVGMICILYHGTFSWLIVEEASPIGPPN
jgi:hypothetical protein